MEKIIIDPSKLKAVYFTRADVPVDNDFYQKDLTPENTYLCVYPGGTLLIVNASSLDASKLLDRLMQWLEDNEKAKGDKILVYYGPVFREHTFLSKEDYVDYIQTGKCKEISIDFDPGFSGGKQFYRSTQGPKEVDVKLALFRPINDNWKIYAIRPSFLKNVKLYKSKQNALVGYRDIEPRNV